MEHAGELEDAMKQDATNHAVRETDIALREQVLAELERSMSEREQRIVEESRAVEEKKTQLTQREQALIGDEQKREAGFADERAILNAELRDKRFDTEREIANSREQKLAALDDEVARLRAKRLADISSAENIERDRIRADISREREAWDKRKDDARQLLDAEHTELARQKGALSALQSEIEGRKLELENSERALERKDQRLEQQSQRRIEQLDEELGFRLEEARKSLDVLALIEN